MPVTIAITLIYFISFFCLLFIYKILNIGKEIDLKVFWISLNTFIKDNTFFMLFSTGFLLLSLLASCFLVMFFLKNVISLNFMRLDFLFINAYPLRPSRIIYPSSYDKWKAHFTELLDNLLSFIYKILDLLPESRRRSVIKLVYLYDLQSYYGLFLFLILFFFDILFNNFVIQKLYYGLPLIFLYQLLLIMSRFRVLVDDEENLICTMLYHQLVFYDSNKEEYLYSNNYTFSVEDLRRLQILISCNFNRELASKKIYDERNK